MQVIKIKEEISKLIANGDISSNVLSLLQSDSKFLKKESNLWDYKREIDIKDKISTGEIIKDITAFYNTFGGYLLIGIEDDGNIIGCKDFNEKQLKDQIYSYTGSHIDISISFVENICIIHIPKRDTGKTPLAFSKLGPEKNKKSIFKPGDIYFRAEDNSQSISNDKDLSFLIGDRDLYNSKKEKVSTNNLPEKSSIFNQFIGRNIQIKNLNEWLLDPFRKYMVLAGPGGVGKTSIAYTFCENLCINNSLGFEQIIWISAKTEQFNAIKNQNIPLPYLKDSRNYGQYYSSIDTLLDAISYHYPILDSEWDELEFNTKLQLLVKYAGSIKSFIVIDDLDSLTIDDQRNAIQLAMYFGQSENRFLFTTRKNFLAPSSNTIEVNGLKSSEYQSLLEKLCDLFTISLNAKQKLEIERETDGSPLLTESIFRLLKLGDSFDIAIERWKNKDGEVARAKSFEREILQLSFNSKTILYTLSLAESLSKTELIRLTELVSNEIEDSYQQLEQLFLINVKSIGDQPRFSINSTQKRAIRDLGKNLISDTTDIEKRFIQLRKESRQSLSKGNNKEIGQTIQQAIAQISSNDFSGATATVRSKISKINDNADLWMMYGRCLSIEQPIDVQETRNSFEKSYFYGKREFQLFDLWLNFEINFGNSNSAIDVVKKGDLQHNNINWQWQRLSALSYFKRGSERAKRSDYRDAISDFEKSVRIISKVLKNCPSTIKREIIEISQEISNSIVFCFKRTNLLTANEKIHILLTIINNGEKREFIYLETIKFIKLIKDKNQKHIMIQNLLTMYAKRIKSKLIDQELETLNFN